MARITRVLCPLMFSVFSAVATLAAQSSDPFVRYPALSPDGATLAFSYQGDIWTVPFDGGDARRLTVHEGYEYLPKWSADGTRIGYTSRQFGNDDIFVMTADGFDQRRLTYNSSADRLSGWTPDGRLLFNTMRTWRQVERVPEMYSVAAAGGTPDRLLDALGTTPVSSPDGRFIAFVFGTNNEFRIGYPGPADRDLWIHDTQTGEYTALTDEVGNDFAPAWTGARSLMFISERDGTNNLYRLSIDDAGRAEGAPQRVTSFQGTGVRSFSVSNGGDRIALERDTHIYTIAGSASPVRVPIRVPSAQRFDAVERRTFQAQATELAVSPSGEYVAFVVRGEIFLRESDPERDRTVRVTQHPYRDMEVAWLNDRELLFSSDREGQFELYVARSSDPDEADLFKTLRREIVRMTDTPDDESEATVAPNGEAVAFVRGEEFVVAAYRDGRLQDERVMHRGWALPFEVAWSPDSKWLAYSMPDLDFNEEVYIEVADGTGEPVNVSQHPRTDGSPVWSADGSKLGFLSERNNGDADVWFAWLRRSDWERSDEDWERLEAIDEETDDDATDVEVSIDLERIWERLEQVTSLPGNERDLSISKDGKTFYFVSNRPARQTYEADEDVYSVKWDGTDMERLTRDDAAPQLLVMDPDGEHLYMLRGGGRLARLDPSGDRGAVTMAFSARMDVHRMEEQAQIFDEAWRTLDHGFYDPSFHGNDWSALHDKYRPWAMKAETTQDFRDVFNMMLGELNASHLALQRGDEDDTQNEHTGFLGIDIDPLENGVRVERVVPGSPASREASRLEVGDVITAVEGAPVTASENFYALLVDRADEQTILTVRGSDDSTREVVIEPVASLSALLYDEWVQDRRRLTEEYSNGRLGYIHVQAMDWPSFERFERELMVAGHGKEGLVVDVRFNGGGWTTDYLLSVLMVQQHAYTIPRGAADDLSADRGRFREHYPYGERLPLSAWTKPAAALANSSSFSNAEIFSHAFKTLGRGPLVGEPTNGSVISTGARRLIDGSAVRLPSRGWFVKATDQPMELGPAIPDVIIESRPDDRAHAADAQLRAAVDALLASIDGPVAIERGAR